MLLRGLVVLVALWAVVFTVIRVAGSMKPSAEKVNRYLDDFSLAEITDPDERLQKIGEAAELLNQLEASELNKLTADMEQDPRRELFEELTTEEQLYFFQKRVGRAFEQMMQSFNEMEREDRQRIVERTLSRMQSDDGRRPGGQRLEEQDPEMAAKMAEAGFKAYYEAPVLKRRLILPLMEEMQRTIAAWEGVADGWVGAWREPGAHHGGDPCGGRDSWYPRCHYYSSIGPGEKISDVDTMSRAVAQPRNQPERIFHRERRPVPRNGGGAREPGPG